MESKLKYGDMYACLRGKHAGKFLIFMESGNDGHWFLSVPNMDNEFVPKLSFDNGLTGEIIEFVENVPIQVKQTSKAKFEENKKGL